MRYFRDIYQFYFLPSSLFAIYPSPNCCGFAAKCPPLVFTTVRSQWDSASYFLVAPLPPNKFDSDAPSRRCDATTGFPTRCVVLPVGFRLAK